jgi:hypothetical protein
LYRFPRTFCAGIAIRLTLNHGQQALCRSCTIIASCLPTKDKNTGILHFDGSINTFTQCRECILSSLSIRKWFFLLPSALLQ